MIRHLERLIERPAVVAGGVVLLLGVAGLKGFYAGQALGAVIFR